MKKLVVGMVLFLAGCATKTVYVDRYSLIYPEDTLLKSYYVDQPPATAVAYSALSCDAKESLWVNYTNDLLNTIGLHEADKSGLRKWKIEATARVDKMNKEIANKK